jgi:hypothetical protein
LKIFKKELEYSTKNLISKLEVQRLCLQFLDISKLLVGFSKVFGTLLSVSVFFSILAITFRVCDNFAALHWNILSHFLQSYIAVCAFRVILQLGWRDKFACILRCFPILVHLIALVISPCERIEVEVSFLHKVLTDF